MSTSLREIQNTLHCILFSRRHYCAVTVLLLYSLLVYLLFVISFLLFLLLFYRIIKQRFDYGIMTVALYNLIKNNYEVVAMGDNFIEYIL